VKAFVDSIGERQIRAEFELLRSVRSRFIAHVYDLVKSDHDEWCMVMEYIHGDTLERVLSRRGRLADAELQRLAYNLFAAVESIHPQIERMKSLRANEALSPFEKLDYFRLMNEGYIHRDLKPENIIITDEKTFDLRLVDLGLAKPAAARGLSRVGTLDYMPPDVGLVPWDASFDLYAVAVILFRSMCGTLPASISSERLNQLSFDLRVKRRNRASSFFDRALAPSTSDRFTSVQEMRAAFEPVVVTTRHTP
jgi:serine/threonine protein kinase